jgi:hypothetical protein
MQGMIRCGLLAGLLVGCHTSDPATPDAPPIDGHGPPGLHVTWESEPATYPGNLEDWLTVKSVDLTAESLRVIGDAGPGDPRTTKAAFQLRWDKDDSPQPIDFVDAPTGLYSKLSLQLDGYTLLPSLEIEGQVVLAGVTLDFEVEDRNAVPVSLDCDRMLQPGGSAVLAVKLRLHDALTSIDWESLPVHDGKIELETGNPQLDDFVEKFGRAFSIDNSGPH